MKKLFVVILLIGFLLLVSCSNINELKAELEMAGEVAEAYDDVYVHPQDSDIKDKAFEKLDFSECDKINDKWQTNKKNCYSDIAVKLKDKTICQKIPADYQSYCYLRVAQETYDSNLCEFVSSKPDSLNIDRKAECIITTANSAKVCQSLNDDGSNKKNNCFILLARHTIEISICDNIKDDNSNAICVRSVAIELKNLKMCEQITIKFHKDFCLKEIGG